MDLEDLYNWPSLDEEILESIKLCAMEKAPGSDGFPMTLFLSFWVLLKEDIISTVQYFHTYQTFERSFNATFIALIPKKVGASELKDYRPISLIWGGYKILAKILTEILKKGGSQAGEQTSNDLHKRERNYVFSSNS